MRIVFIGAGKVSVETAKALIKKGHKVIIVEPDKARIDELAEELDCSFLNGDGSRPDVLKETNPKQTDYLVCLANSDQVNVIAGLVGRSLGFRHIITSIVNPEFDSICMELGLKDIIIPSRTISRYLADTISGSANIELSSIIRDEARFFTFAVKEEDAVPISDLNLPPDARIICFYREGKFLLPDEEMKLHKGDEVVIITHSKNMSKLNERWPSDQKNIK